MKNWIVLLIVLLICPLHAYAANKQFKYSGAAFATVITDLEQRFNTHILLMEPVAQRVTASFDAERLDDALSAILPPMKLAYNIVDGVCLIGDASSSDPLDIAELTDSKVITLSHLDSAVINELNEYARYIAYDAISETAFISAPMPILNRILSAVQERTKGSYGISIAYSIELLDMGSESFQTPAAGPAADDTLSIGTIVSAPGILNSIDGQLKADLRSKKNSHRVLQKPLLITTPGTQARLTTSVEPLSTGNAAPEIFSLTVTPTTVDVASRTITSAIEISNKGPVENSLKTEVTTSTGEPRVIALLQQTEAVTGSSRQVAIVLTATPLNLGTAFDNAKREVPLGPQNIDRIPPGSSTVGVGTGYCNDGSMVWSANLLSPVDEDSRVVMTVGSLTGVWFNYDRYFNRAYDRNAYIRAGMGIMTYPEIRIGYLFGIGDRVDIAKNAALYAAYNPIGFFNIDKGPEIVNDWYAGIELLSGGVKCDLQIEGSKYLTTPVFSVTAGYQITL